MGPKNNIQFWQCLLSCFFLLNPRILFQKQIMKPRRHKFMFHLLYLFSEPEYSSFFAVIKGVSDMQRSQTRTLLFTVLISLSARLPLTDSQHNSRLRSGSVFSKFWNVLLCMKACRLQLGVIVSWFDITGDGGLSLSTALNQHPEGWSERSVNVCPSTSGLGSGRRVCAGNGVYMPEYSQCSRSKRTENSTGLLEVFCMYVDQKGFAFLYIPIPTCFLF